MGNVVGMGAKKPKTEAAKKIAKLEKELDAVKAENTSLKEELDAIKAESKA